MRLHSPEFEKRLKRSVRKTVRASRDLRKQARTVTKPTQYNIATVARFLSPGVLALGVGGVADLTKNPAASLAVITLWMLVWVCVRIAAGVNCLYRDPNLAAFSFLPIGDRDIFRWQFQKFLRVSAIGLLDLFVGLSTFAWCYHFTAAQWLLVPLIVALTMALSLALVLLGVARYPLLPYQIVPALVVISALIIFTTHYWTGRYVMALLNDYAPQINLLPTGWALSLCRIPVEPGQWLKLLLLLPIGGLIFTVKDSLSRLRFRYEFIEVVAPRASDLVPGKIDPASAEDDVVRVGASEIEEIILTGQFFAIPKWWETGRVEKALWNWFTPRERALSEFVFPNGVAIGKPWWRIFRNLAIAVAGACAVGMVAPVLVYWVIGAGVFVTFSQALNQILLIGGAFRPTSCSGVNIPLYAAYAIGFRELARVLFKCTLIQAPFLLLYTTLGAALATYLAGHFSLIESVSLGVKVGGLLLATRFIAVTFAFSSGTNDTLQFRFLALFMFGFVAIAGILYLGLGAAGVLASLGAPAFSGTSLLAWGLTALAILDAYALFRIYGWFYHLNRFDLMRPVQ